MRGLDGARSISVSPDGGTALVVSATTGSIAVFRDTTTAPSRAPTPAPTIAPTSDGGDVPPPSDNEEEEEWYERLVAIVGIGGVVATVATWVVLRLLVAHGCCCCCFAAAVVRRKKKVECPACGKEVEVKPEALDDDTRCWCDVLRSKAEAQAKINSGTGGGGGGVFADERGGRGGARETGSELASAFSAAREAGAGREEGKVLFHPDPRHVTTCPHCGVVFCPPCDVRDKKRMFPFLFENNSDEGKEEETRAAGPSAMESGTAKKVKGFRSPQHSVVRSMYVSRLIYSWCGGRIQVGKYRCARDEKDSDRCGLRSVAGGAPTVDSPSPKCFDMLTARPLNIRRTRHGVQSSSDDATTYILKTHSLSICSTQSTTYLSSCRVEYICIPRLLSITLASFLPAW